MLTKIWTIAYNGLYRTYIDQMALMFMFAAPLAISVIMAMAFGGGGGDISLPDSTIIVVNLDEGTTGPDGNMNFGQQYIEVLVDNPPEGISDLLTGEVGADADDARQQVKDGDVTAALIIPAGFSASVFDSERKGEVEVYYNPGSEIGSTIVLAIVDGITNNLNNILVAQNVLVGAGDGYFMELAETPDAGFQAWGVVVNRLGEGDAVTSVQFTETDVGGEDEDINLLSYFAPGIAIMFMTYAMAAGTRAILEEQRDWIMQRVISTPTPRWVYLTGRLVGNYTTGLLQMVILLVATPVVAVMTGGSADVWGNNFIGIALITLAVVFAGTGLGLLLSAISNTVRQAETLSNAVLFLMAMIGGSFMQVEDVPVLDVLSKFTLNHWGLTGYFDLATGDAGLGDIMVNVGAMTAMGAGFFLIALWRFNRRLNF